MITLASNLYDDNEDTEAAMEIVCNIVAADRRVDRAKTVARGQEAADRHEAEPKNRNSDGYHEKRPATASTCA